MFYAARGSIPHTRHTQHRAPDGSLYAEELFGVEGFTGRSSLLYHVTPPTRTHRIEPVATIDPRGGRRRLPPPPADRRGRGRAARRRGHRAHPAVLQQRRRDGRRPPGRADARDALLPQRRGRRDALRPRGRGPPRHQLRADPLRPGRLPRAPDRHDLAPRARRGECPADALPRVPVRDRAAEALPQRLRPAARALAVLAARHPAPRRGPGPDRRGRVPGPRQDAQPADRLPLRAPPVRRRRLGRLPLAVRLQHRRLRADHRAGPPAAAGPPDVRGAELRRLLVRAAQVRLPPAGDPGARTTTRTSTPTRSSTTSPATS